MPRPAPPPDRVVIKPTLTSAKPAVAASAIAADVAKIFFIFVSLIEIFVVSLTTFVFRNPATLTDFCGM
jgi:hypothetical protein